MPRDRSRTSDGTGDHERRLEPVLLRAAEDDNVEVLEELLATAKRHGQLNENLLRISLQRAAEKDRLNATVFLLKAGARPDAPGKRAGPLMRAVDRGFIRIVKAILENKPHHADRDERDKKGRTLLMTAAWKNHWHILQLLITAGADINAKDWRKRNVLHNLAADKQCDWGEEVINLLLRYDVSVDGPDAQDELLRTPLHWCSTTGKRGLAEKLLSRPRMPSANVNAVEIRQKTPLHMAASHGRDDIVELLLAYDANVNAASDGCWTPLHNACQKGSDKIVRMLLAAGALPNARLLNGVTPLHIAAEEGHVDVVTTLLDQPGVKRTARDSFGYTAFLRAAQRKHRECVNILAPCNNFKFLSKEAVGACQGFFATVTDFGNYRHDNKVRRMSVYELLFAKSKENYNKPAFEALPTGSKATTFRWIHLPANNISWIEALMSKVFVEEGHHDVEGFKAIERSFTNQHRGLRVHSHFMRPLCQTMPKGTTTREREADSESKPTAPEQAISPVAQISRANTSLSNESTAVVSSIGSIGPSPSTQIDSKEPKVKKSRKANRPPNHKKVSNREGNSTPKPEQTKKRWNSNDSLAQAKPVSDPKTKSSSHLSAKPGSYLRHSETMAQSNIVFFGPFLHFETSSARKQMQEAIKRARLLDPKHDAAAEFGKHLSCDELLIRAHLSSSSVSLHVRRTLDQFFYHNIDTESRDVDQVVFRYQATNQGSAHTCDPKIFMVDQLWMWILGKDLIVTSFPQRWHQPRNDPLNVLDGIIEDVNSKTREPIGSVYDLALTISARCSGLFDRHRLAEGDYQFLDMFEASIGTATDKETILFNDFNKASALASDWLKSHRKPTRFSRSLESTSRQTEHDMKHEHKKDPKFSWDDDEDAEPMFVDKLLDIGRETDLLAESKDIRDEINMIYKVLDDQKQILPDLGAAICDIYGSEQRSQQEARKRIRDQLKTIEMHMKDLDRMDKQAERIYDSITNLLDLKQKHANAFEARFARDQAAGTARQSQTIMVFTIVTIIFLPLTFITGFFAINIKDFPRDPQIDWGIPMGYAVKYVFGIGISVSIPLIAIALSLDDIGDAFRHMMRRWRDRRGGQSLPPQPSAVEEVKKSLEVQSLRSALSNVRSYRRDSAWANYGHRRESLWQNGGNLLPVTSRTAPSYRS